MEIETLCFIHVRSFKQIQREIKQTGINCGCTQIEENDETVSIICRRHKKEFNNKVDCGCILQSEMDQENEMDLDEY